MGGVRQLGQYALNIKRGTAKGLGGWRIGEKKRERVDTGGKYRSRRGGGKKVIDGKPKSDLRWSRRIFRRREWVSLCKGKDGKDKGLREGKIKGRRRRRAGTLGLNSWSATNLALLCCPNVNTGQRHGLTACHNG